MSISYLATRIGDQIPCDIRNCTSMILRMLSKAGLLKNAPAVFVKLILIKYDTFDLSIHSFILMDPAR